MAFNYYQNCPFKRPPFPKDADVDTAALEKFSLDCNVIPMFEISSYQYKYRKVYSFETNKFLKWRWGVFTNTQTERAATRAPYKLADDRDLHFINGQIMYRPDESAFKKTDFRMKMRTGPGVDHLGIIPMADDLQIKRTIGTQRKYPKKYDKVVENK